MKRKIMTSLALSLIIFGSSSAVYANDLDTDYNDMITVSHNEDKDCPKHKHHHKAKHKKFIVDFLKEKHKMTDKEIQTQLDSGKNLRDILKEKNVKPEELKKYMLERKYKEIDEAVKSGEITKEEAKQKKQRIKERMDERQKMREEKKN
ncbi:MAG TPA: hypothetical protein VLM81_01955 [Peptostreptococcaceae bacterium]|nr:hypothetical protein [Peptostreptococcaceae bacterium]